MKKKIGEYMDKNNEFVEMKLNYENSSIFKKCSKR